MESDEQEVSGENENGRREEETRERRRTVGRKEPRVVAVQSRQRARRQRQAYRELSLLSPRKLYDWGVALVPIAIAIAIAIATVAALQHT